MKFFTGILLFCVFSCGPHLPKQNIPPELLGRFEDDYGIQYTLDATTLVQEPRISYHILQWNTKDKYIIAKNDAENPSEKNLYTRIDYVMLQNMEPYTWAFCYTTYNAVSVKAALAFPVADTAHPRTGCNGFPFSRLKKM